jgi:hypothetical protein
VDSSRTTRTESEPERGVRVSHTAWTLQGWRWACRPRRARLGLPIVRQCLRHLEPSSCRRSPRLSFAPRSFAHRPHKQARAPSQGLYNPNPCKAVSGGQPNAHMRVRVPPPCVPSHAPLLLRDHPWMIAPLMCLCRLHTVAMCLRPVAMFECLTYVLYLTFALQGTIHGVHLPTPQPRTFCRSLHKAERDDCRAEMGSSQSHPSHPPPIPAHAPWDGTGAAIHSAGWWYAMLYRHGDVTARYNGQLISRVLT